MTRAYARSERGERAVGHVPKNWGDSVTLAAGIGLSGLIAPLILRGSMNGDIFEAYVEQFILPELSEGDIVVLDNLSAHKRGSVRALIEAAGALVIFLPPYSPDLNPIELAWSKVKPSCDRAQPEPTTASRAQSSPHSPQSPTKTSRVGFVTAVTETSQDLQACDSPPAARGCAHFLAPAGGRPSV